ncbi:hypothetical protein [Planomonospora sp. ID82291]|uniref:hypothetical protein n=1 Tax=Planomonospora sp. ID82291 TaxID=2738136 RepID=UPI0018C38AB7|nr:hypothetical protein [Planomonospora sp. ID82291]MBG0819076.1 hypothetical protein [Planomonospora sp. ID82291]
MDTEDLARFGELLAATGERRELTVSELYEAGWLLGEVAAYTAALARHLDAELADLPGRVILRDDTGGDPAARITEAREHLARYAELAAAAAEPASRYHSAAGHLAVAVDPGAAGD